MTGAPAQLPACLHPCPCAVGCGLPATCRGERQAVRGRVSLARFASEVAVSAMVAALGGQLLMHEWSEHASSTQGRQLLVTTAQQASRTCARRQASASGGGQAGAAADRARAGPTIHWRLIVAAGGTCPLKQARAARLGPLLSLWALRAAPNASNAPTDCTKDPCTPVQHCKFDWFELGWTMWQAAAAGGADEVGILLELFVFLRYVPKQCSCVPF